MGQEKEIYPIGLTGGPCSGKSTAFCFLQEKLSNYGIAVYLNREVATEFLMTGITPAGGRMSLIDFEEQILLHMIEKENRYHRAAELSAIAKNVIINDRGTMDVAAYLQPHEFEMLLLRNHLKIVQIRDQRYKGIFHLRTAALGAESFYTLENNPMRVEKTLEEARIVDEKTLQAWNGHPHVRVIDNSTDFESKMKRLLASICRVIGIPVPLEIERKYLVRRVDMSRFPVPFQAIDIEQVYLCDDGSGEQRRIRKRGQYGTFVYYLTRKRNLRSSVRVETENHITGEEYVLMRHNEYDPERRPIQKKRNCFIWKDQYFELDEIKGFGQMLLERELTEENDTVSLPPFLDVVEDVTDDPRFSNSEIAKIKQ